METTNKQTLIGYLMIPANFEAFVSRSHDMAVAQALFGIIPTKEESCSYIANDLRHEFEGYSTAEIITELENDK
jgi:hypothetical protein